MLRCPKCGADARTSGYCRYIEKDNIYIRGRKCIGCGHTFRTTEMTVDNNEDAVELYKIFSKLMRKFLK